MAIRYKLNGRKKLGILDHALLKVLGTKKAKETFARKLKAMGLLPNAHGHAGTQQVRVSAVHNGKVSTRTRLWVVDERKFKQFAEAQANP
jgi:hypothetical protein